MKISEGKLRDEGRIYLLPVIGGKEYKWAGVSDGDSSCGHYALEVPRASAPVLGRAYSCGKQLVPCGRLERGKDRSTLSLSKASKPRDWNSEMLWRRMARGRRSCKRRRSRRPLFRAQQSPAGRAEERATVRRRSDVISFLSPGHSRAQTVTQRSKGGVAFQSFPSFQ